MNILRRIGMRDGGEEPEPCAAPRRPRNPESVSTSPLAGGVFPEATEASTQLVPCRPVEDFAAKV